MVVGLREVAERAGVSVRTASNVANDFPHVAPETRRRVQAAIEELKYRPNTAARQLRRGRTEVISLVVPEISSPYFSELAAITVRVAAERGWTVHIDQTDGDADQERRMILGPAGRSVDGVLCSPWAVSPAELVELAAGPVVLLGERETDGVLDHVAIDNVRASREATLHLLARGDRVIGAIGAQPHLQNGTAELRVEGYRQALESAGLPFRTDLVMPVRSLHRPDGAAAVTRLLEVEPRVDAVFCFSDELALGALRTLLEQGRRVPQDVAVVGFDDIEDGRYSTPTLTTIAPDKTQIVRVALDRLAARIAGQTGSGAEAPLDLVVPHRLLIRESTTSVRTRKG
ncbi:LacI family DNA-binding transcriptional regulator [Allobranchiibius sp. CTAmp26]|uniref:LacI family DNA-binding transcriptional regulator n=1 Tax=Allobranchiibius sp. CTAmp26 TaxID=2815214 RepID=UPI001AA16399|nr:LacI family DNA-binding transcriptional regulator [Allobranchiibius sp. CTAmp26]MBO1753724.1 LacI family DNA-binding transcriptional regulator [Allobranchiibius sp. CTAmp26]